MVDSDLSILHVTNRFFGGVKTAISHLTDADFKDQHYLLDLSPGQADLNSKAILQATVRCRSKNPFSIRQAIKKACKDWNIDVIHAHSTWAGVYSRVFCFGVPVVYQPHGLSFSNPAKGKLPRLIYLFVERLLARRSDAAIAVGKYEYKTIIQNLPVRKVEIIRNWSSHEVKPWKNIKPESNVVIGSVGRLCTEKDPLFFLKLATKLNALSSNYSFVWLGAGENNLEQALISGGIRVTGWIDPKAVEDQMEKLDIYVSTSISEAMPFAFLDSVSTGIPTFLRQIPAFSEEGLPTFYSEDELASAIHGFVNGKMNGAYLESFDEHRNRFIGLKEIERYRSFLLSLTRNKS